MGKKMTITELKKYVASKARKLMEAQILKESGGHAAFGSMAFAGHQKEEFPPLEGEVELKSLSPGDIFEFLNSELRYKVVGNNPEEGGIDITYSNGNGHWIANENAKVRKLANFIKKVQAEELVEPKMPNEL